MCVKLQNIHVGEYMEKNFEVVLKELLSIADNYFSERTLEDFCIDAKMWGAEIQGYFSQLKQSGNSLTLEMVVLSDNHIIDVTYKECTNTNNINRVTTLIKLEKIASYHFHRKDHSVELHFHSTSGNCLLYYSANTEENINRLINFSSLFAKLS